MEFAERLKTLRKQVKLTQAQIAEKLDISQQAYASWERGVKKPTQENLVKIAQVLNVSVDYLVGNSEEKSDELDNIELLFRMNSRGLTDEEKEIFKKELIEFMEKRKKAFNKGNWSTMSIAELQVEWGLSKIQLVKELRVSVKSIIR